jgi:hypothetical protein
MSYRERNDAELANSVRSLINSLSAHKVTCLDNALADTLAAQLASLNTAFEADIEESATITARKLEVNSRKRDRRAQIINSLSTVQRYLDAAHGSAANYERCGFSFRRKWTSVVAKQPDNLSAVGDWTRGNKLKFDGNNTRGSVIYEVSRSEGRSGNWSFAGSTKKQSFTDKTAVPGQCYQYRVRAVAPRSTSDYSNEAIVYAPV